VNTATMLVDWLNRQGMSPAASPVIRAMSLLRKKNLSGDECRELLQIFGSIRLEFFLIAGEHTYMLEGNELKTVGVVVHDPAPARSPVLDWFVAGKQWKELDDGGPVLLARVSQERLLEGIGECRQCKNWFAAQRVARKRFCSADCQQAFWLDKRKTVEGRKLQRERMARWRAMQRSKKQGGSK
jgi:hypothetical protein